jgi:uncharacterized protein (TIGR02145 family)
MACKSGNTELLKAFRKSVSELSELFVAFYTNIDTLKTAVGVCCETTNANLEAIKIILRTYIDNQEACCLALLIKLDVIEGQFRKIRCCQKKNEVTTTTEPSEATSTEAVITSTEERICDEPTSFHGYNSFPSFNTKYVGEETGRVYLTFDAHEIPDKFQVWWDGVKRIDTGYVGLEKFQSRLDAALFNNYGLPPELISDESSGVAYFDKDSAFPDTVDVLVFSPMKNTQWDFTISCPQEVTTTTSEESTTTTEEITTTTTPFDFPCDKCYELSDTIVDGIAGLFRVTDCDDIVSYVTVPDGTSVYGYFKTAVSLRRGGRIRLSDICTSSTTVEPHSSTTEEPHTSTSTEPIATTTEEPSTTTTDLADCFCMELLCDEPGEFAYFDTIDCYGHYSIIQVGFGDPVYRTFMEAMPRDFFGAVDSSDLCTTTTTEEKTTTTSAPYCDCKWYRLTDVSNNGIKAIFYAIHCTGIENLIEVSYNSPLDICLCYASPIFDNGTAVILGECEDFTTTTTEPPYVSTTTALPCYCYLLIDAFPDAYPAEFEVEDCDGEIYTLFVEFGYPEKVEARNVWGRSYDAGVEWLDSCETTTTTEIPVTTTSEPGTTTSSTEIPPTTTSTTEEPSTTTSGEPGTTSSTEEPGTTSSTEEGTTTTTTLEVKFCNDEFSGGMDFPIGYEISMGAEESMVRFNYETNLLPIRIALYFDGMLPPKFDTGYVGDVLTYNYGGSGRALFIASLSSHGVIADFITNPDDGYPLILSDSTGYVDWDKDSATESAYVYIYAPMATTYWEVLQECPGVDGTTSTTTCCNRPSGTNIELVKLYTVAGELPRDIQHMATLELVCSSWENFHVRFEDVETINSDKAEYESLTLTEKVYSGWDIECDCTLMEDGFYWLYPFGDEGSKFTYFESLDCVAVIHISGGLIDLIDECCYIITTSSSTTEEPHTTTSSTTEEPVIITTAEPDCFCYELQNKCIGGIARFDVEFCDGTFDTIYVSCGNNFTGCFKWALPRDVRGRVRYCGVCNTSTTTTTEEPVTTTTEFVCELEVIVYDAECNYEETTTTTTTELIEHSFFNVELYNKSTCIGYEPKLYESPVPLSVEEGFYFSEILDAIVQIIDFTGDGSDGWLPEDIMVYGRFDSCGEVRNAISTTTTECPECCYGLLYNWRSIDTGLLAPTDWHVPTDAEWTTLINYLGGESVASGKLKSLCCWIEGYEEATNQSGFTAIPGGLRNFGDGLFGDIGNSCQLWSFTEYDANAAWSMLIGYDFSIVDLYHKTFGLSIRCLLDGVDPADPGFVVDIDGNTYTTVKIGTQVWMAENLKVQHYKNGEVIPEVTDNTDWSNLITGALCAYDNDWGNACLSEPTTTTTCIGEYIDALAPTEVTIIPDAVGDNPVTWYYKIYATMGGYRSLFSTEFPITQGDSTNQIIFSYNLPSWATHVYIMRAVFSGGYTPEDGGLEVVGLTESPYDIFGHFNEMSGADLYPVYQVWNDCGDEPTTTTTTTIDPYVQPDPFYICADVYGDAMVVTTALPTPTFQWQWDLGSGTWIDIGFLDGIYGYLTDTLYVPGFYDNFLFRCKVTSGGNDYYSNEVELITDHGCTYYYYICNTYSVANCSLELSGLELRFAEPLELGYYCSWRIDNVILYVASVGGDGHDYSAFILSGKYNSCAEAQAGCP